MAFLRMRDLSDQTINLRRLQLGRCARYLDKPPFEVTLPDLLAMFGAQVHWARNTALGHRSALIVFYEWAMKVGLTDTDPTSDLPKMKPPVPHPNPVPEPDFAASLATAEPRIAMAMRLMGSLGLRRAETAQVHRDDLIESPEGWLLKILGKGRKERIVPIPSRLAVELIAWIDANGEDGFAFPAPGGGHISPHWMGTLVSRALPDGYTGHKLRHRALTQTYNATKDILLTATLAGHSSVATTQSYYVEPDYAALRAAVERISS